METIIIPTNKGLQFCNTENIIRIQGMGNYCRIYFADNSYALTIAKLLNWFEDRLPGGVAVVNSTGYTSPFGSPDGKITAKVKPN